MGFFNKNKDNNNSQLEHQKMMSKMINWVTQDTNGRILNVGNFNFQNSLNRYNVLLNQFSKMQNSSILLWENIPFGVNSMELENLRYIHRQLFTFKRLGKIFLTNWTQTGVLDEFNRPTYVRPMLINGNAFPIAPVKVVYGDTIPKENEGIFLTDIYDLPKISLIQTVIEDMANIFHNTRVNIKASNGKIYVEMPSGSTQPQMQKMKDMLEEQLDSGSPIVIIPSGILDDSKLTLAKEVIASDFFKVLGQYNALRMQIIGMHSNHFGTGTDRVVASELANDENQIELIARLSLYMAKHFCDRLNKGFGTNLKVMSRVLDELKKDDDVDSNNQNDDEREADL